MAPADEVLLKLRDMGVPEGQARLMALNPARAPLVLAERKLRDRALGLTPVVDRPKRGRHSSVPQDVPDALLACKGYGAVARVAREHGINRATAYSARRSMRKRADREVTAPTNGLRA